MFLFSCVQLKDTTDALKLGDLDGMDLPDFTAQAVVVPKGSVSNYIHLLFLYSESCQPSDQIRSKCLNENCCTV